MSKYETMTNDELLEKIAEDLVTMHIDTGIDLAYWDTALEIVGRFYYTSIGVSINGKMKP
jgi:hypothetical protein